MLCVDLLPLSLLRGREPPRVREAGGRPRARLPRLQRGRGERLQPTQKLKANLANPIIRLFLIHYFEL